MTANQQQTFMRGNPNTFTPASGAWGRQRCTMVRLDAVDDETLGEAMTLAWQQTATANLKTEKSKLKPKKPTAKTKTKRRVYGRR